MNEPDEFAARDFVAEIEAISEADKSEVSAPVILDFSHELPTEPERVVSSEEPRYVTDAELQAELDDVMPGARLMQRTTQTTVTDVFVNGGNYAPGRQRWIQTPTLSTPAAVAAIIKEVFG